MIKLHVTYWSIGWKKYFPFLTCIIIRLCRDNTKMWVILTMWATRNLPDFPIWFASLYPDTTPYSITASWLSVHTYQGDACCNNVTQSNILPKMCISYLPSSYILTSSSNVLTKCLPWDFLTSHGKETNTKLAVLMKRKYVYPRLMSIRWHEKIWLNKSHRF